MKRDRSLLTWIRGVFGSTQSTRRASARSSQEWVEIRAPSESIITGSKATFKPNYSQSQHSSSPNLTIPQTAFQVRPLTKDRLQSERTAFTDRDPIKPLTRLSTDELRKKFPGAFNDKR